MKKVLLTVTALSGLGLASAMEIQPDMQDQQPKVIAHPRPKEIRPSIESSVVLEMFNSFVRLTTKLQINRFGKK